MRHRSGWSGTAREGNGRRARWILWSAVAAALAALVGFGGSVAFAGPRPIPTPQPRIVGGVQAPVGAFPFAVAIEEWNGSTFQPYCGGSLIAHRWVLTAAHCAFGRQGAEMGNLRLVVGRQRLSGADGAVRRAAAIRIDPDYDPASEAYDSALIQLDQPVADPVPALVEPGDDAATKAGTAAMAIGWGSTVPQPPNGIGPVSFPDSLRQVWLPIVSDGDCSSVFNGRDFAAVRTDVMLCAGGDGRVDACVGDSGGPLLVMSGSAEAPSWTQVGITSWGTGCAVRGVPGVFTRLADPAIRSFISSTVGSG